MQSPRVHRNRIFVVSAVAGIAGPLVFTAAFIGQGLFRAGYSHLADPVSALAAGPYGWVQDVNFFVFGALVIVFAMGLHRGLHPARWGRVAVAFLVLGGAGLVLAGVFPARDASGAFSTSPAHFLAAFLTFIGTGIGLALLRWRIAGDLRWRGLASYTLLSGILIVVLFLVTGVLAIPPDAPLHPWLGLLQRLMLAVWFPCTILLALSLFRITRAANAVPSTL